jgi:hypothetical protein
LTDRNKLSRGLAWFHIGFYVIGLPLFLGYLYLSSSNERLESLKDRLGVLYEDLSYEKKRSALWYYPLFTLRRLSFILQSVYLSSTDYQFHNLLLNYSWSTLMLIYILHSKPFATAQTTRLEVFNEFMVMIVTVYHLIAYSLITDLSPDVTYEIGWSFIIAVLGIMIPVNLLVTVNNVLRDLWSKRKIICYYFKKVVLRQTQVIKLRQEAITSATEENLNTESHALPTSRGVHEVFERNAPDRQLRIIAIEDCKVENILDEAE